MIDGISKKPSCERERGRGERKEDGGY